MAIGVDLHKARQIILNSLPAPRIEKCGIINAFGRTLAETIIANTDIPEHALAKHAGYAVIAEDVVNADSTSPKALSIVAHSPQPYKHTLAPGSTIHVERGQALPDGADAVLLDEYTYLPKGDIQITVIGSCRKGDGIIPAGSQSAAGDSLISSGTIIGPGEMAMLAMVGRHGVKVTAGPKVSIITTGSRIVDVIGDLAPGNRRNTVRYSLVGMILEAHCRIGDIIHVAGGRIELGKALESASHSDCIVVALGEEDSHDLAQAALENSGQVSIGRVHLEPGNATTYGKIGNCHVFIIPSQAHLAVFEALIRPALMTMLGRHPIDRLLVSAKLTSTIKLNSASNHYLAARAHWDNHELSVSQTSPDKANALIIVAQGIDMLKRGENADVIMLSQEAHPAP